MKHSKSELLSALKFGTDEVMKKFNIKRSDISIIINPTVAEHILDDMTVIIEEKSIVGIEPIEYGLHKINIDGDDVGVIVDKKVTEIYIVPATQKMKYQNYISVNYKNDGEEKLNMKSKFGEAKLNCTGGLPKADIEITESEIDEFSSKLSDDQVNEYANEYGLTLENARHDLAEYILYNDKLNTQSSKE